MEVMSLSSLYVVFDSLYKSLIFTLKYSAKILAVDNRGSSFSFSHFDILPFVNFIKSGYLLLRSVANCSIVIFLFFS
ncbi:ORF053 [Staphylococcus phage 3A]|uniref:ORF053 n=1 Tax=Staphylococcus phage 3A TaxID=2952374 RepID=Q4ZCR1_9CAUD|nr:ORF053 [Staphylococcus phage 3A]AAX91094.1 ORF053 [Staphylococcus phage 3A]